MPSAPSILVDGIARDHVDARDRGLAFGDGLFETIAVVNGAVINWAGHSARLLDGCSRLAITPPVPDELHEEILRVAVGHDRRVIKVIVTRGVGGVGYAPPEQAQTVRVVMSRAWPADYATKAARGIRIGIAAQPLSSNPRLAGLKHLNRLDQVLASRETSAAGWDEALMLDLAGRVVEATRSNVFAVSDGTLLTPPLDLCGVRGVMRGNVLAVATALNIPCAEASFRPADLAGLDELFVCNAIAGVWPVAEIIGDFARRFAPGTVTGTVRAALIEQSRHP